MKTLAIADLHGFLPEIPECDLLLIAGDICPDYHKMSRARYGTNSIRLTPDRGEPRQANWLRDTFKPWLENVPAETVIGIAGNHDFVFDKTRFLIPRDLPWTYLREESVELPNGMLLYGIPWVPHLPRWAFSLPDDKLEMAYSLVPDEADVVLSHGPPYTFLDFTKPQFGSMHVGAESANTMLDRVHPDVYICGHIHEGRGRVERDETAIYNVAHVDEAYSGFRGPVEIPEIS